MKCLKLFLSPWFPMDWPWTGNIQSCPWGFDVIISFPRPSVYLSSHICTVTQRLAMYRPLYAASLLSRSSQVCFYFSSLLISVPLVFLAVQKSYTIITFLFLINYTRGRHRSHDVGRRIYVSRLLQLSSCNTRVCCIFNFRLILLFGIVLFLFLFFFFHVTRLKYINETTLNTQTRPYYPVINKDTALVSATT